MLTLNNLCKGYEGFSLTINAVIDEGIIALFGVSGSGKTTTLNCISGLTKPDAGTIQLGDRILFSASERINVAPEARRIGYVFQDSLLFPHLRVSDNLAYGLRFTSKKRRRLQLVDLIDLLELGLLLKRLPDTLSGGERQRVALARALATSPDILLLDEPLASLDAGFRGRVLQYLKEIGRRFNVPMLYVSHSIGEVLEIADKALVLDQGKLVAFGPPREVLSQKTVYRIVDTAGLECLVLVKVIEHDVGAGLTKVLMGQDTELMVPLMQSGVPGDLVYAEIRGNDIILSLERPVGLSARNVISAKVDAMHPVGSKALIYVWVGVMLVVEVSLNALEELNLHCGQTIFLIIKSSSITTLE